MAEFALRPLSLGELLDRAFTIFRQRFGTILMILVTCLIIPSLMVLNNIKRFMDLAQRSAVGGSPEEQAQLMFTMFGKILWIAVVFGVAILVARAALGWVTHKALLGEDVDALTAMGQGLKLFFPLLGLQLVETAIIIITEILLYIPMAVLGIGAVAANPQPGAALGLGMIVFMIVYFVAILYLFAALFVTNSTLLAEADTGVFKALERSWTLTKDRRGPIVGAMLLLYLLVWIVMIGVSVAVGVGVGMAGRGPEAVGGTMVGVFGGMLLFGLLVAGYYFVLQMVTYYDLRVRKEGLDLELASAAMPPA